MPQWILLEKQHVCNRKLLRKQTHALNRPITLYFFVSTVIIADMAAEQGVVISAERRFQAAHAHRQVRSALGNSFFSVVRGEGVTGELANSVIRTINGVPRSVTIGTVPSDRDFGVQTLAYREDDNHYVEVFYRDLSARHAWIKYSVDTSLQVTAEEGELQHVVSLADRLSTLEPRVQSVRIADYFTYPAEPIF